MPLLTMDPSSHAETDIPATFTAQASVPPDSTTTTKLKMLNSGNNGSAAAAAIDEIQALEIAAVSKTLSSSAGHNNNIKKQQLDKIKAAATTTRYRECQKNHAASLGNHALDGCGEFMPSGEEGSADALKCAACGCHRNFHRREVEGENLVCSDCYKFKDSKKRAASFAQAAGGFAQGTPVSAAGTVAPGMGYPTSVTQYHQQGKPIAPIGLMALSTGAADSDENEGGGNIGGGGSSPSTIKKRFRTKFSTEQKDEMCNFAEKLGWKMQKHDEAAVQEFCANVGVKRHVLKVWMHNNKHTMAKKA
jgi:ZF-HD class homeobox domain-containing protein